MKAVFSRKNVDLIAFSYLNNVLTYHVASFLSRKENIVFLFENNINI